MLLNYSTLNGSNNLSLIMTIRQNMLLQQIANQKKTNLIKCQHLIAPSVVLYQMK